MRLASHIMYRAMSGHVRLVSYEKRLVSCIALLCHVMEMQFVSRDILGKCRVVVCSVCCVVFVADCRLSWRCGWVYLNCI